MSLDQPCSRPECVSAREFESRVRAAVAEVPVSPAVGAFSGAEGRDAGCPRVPSPSREPFAAWHARECPQTRDRLYGPNRCAHPWVTFVNDPSGWIASDIARFAGKSCIEVYESEAAVAPRASDAPPAGWEEFFPKDGERVGDNLLCDAPWMLPRWQPALHSVVDPRIFRYARRSVPSVPSVPAKDAPPEGWEEFFPAEGASLPESFLMFVAGSWGVCVNPHGDNWMASAGFRYARRSGGGR